MKFVFDGRQYFGFSLIECMVFASIFFIFLSVTNPTLLSFKSERQLIKASNHYSEIFMFARSEAISSGYPIVACQTEDYVNCSESFDPKNGWMVYSLRVSNGGKLRQRRVLLQRASPKWGRAFVLTGTAYKVKFNGFGYVKAETADDERNGNSDIEYPLIIRENNGPSSFGVEASLGLYFNISGEVNTALYMNNG